MKKKESINIENGRFSHCEGYGSSSVGAYSHAEGNGTNSCGDYSHAEGNATESKGKYSHSEGYYTLSQNEGEHSQGKYNVSHKGRRAENKTIHSIGIGTGKRKRFNAVEVMQNGDMYIIGVGGYDGINYDTAKTLQEVIIETGSNLGKGEFSHTEGSLTSSMGISTHAEGDLTRAFGDYSHTEGQGTYTNGKGSHAEGICTIALNEGEHSQGKYNLSHKGSTIHSVGIGNDDNDRKNAVEIMQNGDVYIHGIGNYMGQNLDGAMTLQQFLYSMFDSINYLNDRLDALTGNNRNTESKTHTEDDDLPF